MWARPHPDPLSQYRLRATKETRPTATNSFLSKHRGTSAPCAWSQGARAPPPPPRKTKARLNTQNKGWLSLGLGKTPNLPATCALLGPTGA